MKKHLKKVDDFLETYTAEIAVFSTAVAVALYTSVITYAIVSDRTRINGAAAYLKDNGDLSIGVLQGKKTITTLILKPVNK